VKLFCSLLVACAILDLFSHGRRFYCGTYSYYDDGEGGGTFITAQGGHPDAASATANR
jgi:hypothetical protein